MSQMYEEFATNDDMDMDGGYPKGFRLIGRTPGDRERVFTLLYDAGGDHIKTMGRYIARTPALAASKVYTHVCRIQREQKAYENALQDDPDLTIDDWKSWGRTMNENYGMYRNYIDQIEMCTPQVITIRETTSEMNGGKIIRSNRKQNGSWRQYQYYVWREDLNDVMTNVDQPRPLGHKTTYRQSGVSTQYHYRNRVVPIKRGDASTEDAIQRHLARQADAKRRFRDMQGRGNLGLRPKPRTVI